MRMTFKQSLQLKNIHIIQYKDFCSQLRYTNNTYVTLKPRAWLESIINSKVSCTQVTLALAYLNPPLPIGLPKIPKYLYLRVLYSYHKSCISYEYFKIFNEQNCFLTIIFYIPTSSGGRLSTRITLGVAKKMSR